MCVCIYIYNICVYMHKYVYIYNVVQYCIMLYLVTTCVSFLRGSQRSQRSQPKFLPVFAALQLFGTPNPPGSLATAAAPESPSDADAAARLHRRSWAPKWASHCSWGTCRHLWSHRVTSTSSTYEPIVNSLCIEWVMNETSEAKLPSALTRFRSIEEC